MLTQFQDLAGSPMNGVEDNGKEEREGTKSQRKPKRDAGYLKKKKKKLRHKKEKRRKRGKESDGMEAERAPTRGGRKGEEEKWLRCTLQ